MPKLSEIDQALYQAARQDFAVYMAVVHETDMPWVYSGKARPAPHHMRIVDALQKHNDHTLILQPRGAAKTAIVQAFIEWSFGRASLSGKKDWAKHFRVLYLSHAATQAYTVSLAIMQTIEDNGYFRTIFPDVQKHERKWSEPEWRLKGNNGQSHANFKAGGIDSPPLGGRFDIVVLDDIADEENMTTKAAQEKVLNTLKKTVRPMLTPWGRFIMPCTRWSANDPAQWARDQDWFEIEQKAIVTDEEGVEHSFWPDRWPLTKDDAVRLQERFQLPKVPDNLSDWRKREPREFAQQMQQEVAPEEGLVFEKLWFTNRYDFLPVESIWRYESWDLAQTNNRKSDWSVGLPFNIAPQCPICPAGYWHYFIGPTMFRGKREYGSLKMAILDVYRLLGGLSNNHYALIEKKNAGESLAGEGLPGVNLKFVGALGEGRGGPVKREADLRDVLEVCRSGRVHLPSTEYLARSAERDWVQTLETALYSFDGSFEAHTDDMVITVLQGIIEGEWRRQEHQKLLAQPRTSIGWAHTSRVRRIA